MNDFLEACIEAGETRDSYEAATDANSAWDRVGVQPLSSKTF
jgi:hypothetical protein